MADEGLNVSKGYVMSDGVVTQASAYSTRDIGDPKKLPEGIRLPTKTFRVDTVDMSAAGIMESQTLLFKDPGINVVTFETPSVIMILDKKTSSVEKRTNKFLLQMITKPQQEKFQVIETFGNPHLYFYGQRTRVYNIQGILLDAFYDHEPGTTSEGTATIDTAYRNQWATGFQNFYNNNLRGTILKDGNKIAALYVNGWIIKGYPINLTIMKESNAMPDTVSFQMSWVIESEALLMANKTDSFYKIKTDSGELVKLMNEKSALITKFQEVQAVLAQPTWWMEDQSLRDKKFKELDDLERALIAKEKEINGVLAKYGPRARKTLNID